jgi:hypothetical protein
MSSKAFENEKRAKNSPFLFALKSYQHIISVGTFNLYKIPFFMYFLHFSDRTPHHPHSFAGDDNRRGIPAVLFCPGGQKSCTKRAENQEIGKEN